MNSRIKTYSFLLITTVLTLLSQVSYAQTVGYTYKPLAAEGCDVRYSVSKQDTTFYIITTVSSDRLSFLKEPTMLLKTFDGEVIKLTGKSLGNSSTNGAGVVVGNVVVSSKNITSTAQFVVTPSQFETISKGIAKVRLSTTPIEHERTFNKDKIGAKLYELYLKQKDKDDNF